MNYNDNVSTALIAPCNNEWQRTSGSQLIFELFFIIQKAFRILLFLCAGTFFASDLDGLLSLTEKPLFIGVFFTYYALFLGYRLMLWWRCLFRLQDEQVEFKSGLFRREHKKIHKSQFCDLEVSQSFFQKMFAIYTLQLNAPGGEQCELDLHGISAAQLECLGVKIPKRSDKNQSDTPLSRLVAASFFSWMSIAVFIGGVSSLFGLIEKDEVREFATQELTYFAHSQSINPELFEQPEWVAYLFCGSVLFSFILVLLVVMLKVALTTYPQRLWVENGQFLVSKGTLLKTQSRVSIAKMQHIQVSQSWVGKIRGWYSLILPGDSGQEDLSGCAIVGLQQHQIDEHLASIGQPSMCKLAALPYVKYVPDWYWFSLLKYTGVALVIMYALFWFESEIGDWLMPSSVFVVFMLCISAIITIRSKDQDGWILTSNFLYMREGVFGREWTILPLSQLQMVSVSQSRRAVKYNYCSIHLSTMDSTYDMPAAPLWLVDKLQGNVRETKLTWQQSAFVTSTKSTNLCQTNEPLKA